MIAKNVYRPDYQPRSAVISGRGNPATVSAVFAVAFATLVSGTSSSNAAQINPSRFLQTSPTTQYAAREDDVSINGALTLIRERAGLTVEQLSLLFGVSRKTIYNWLEGRGLKLSHKAAVAGAAQMVRDMADQQPFKIRRALMGEKLPIKKLGSTNGPNLESLSIGPKHGYGASEENTLEILD